MARSDVEPDTGRDPMLESVQDIEETLRADIRSHPPPYQWTQIRPFLHDASSKIEALIRETSARCGGVSIGTEPPRKRARIESPDDSEIPYTATRSRANPPPIEHDDFPAASSIAYRPAMPDTLRSVHAMSNPHRHGPLPVAGADFLFAQKYFEYRGWGDKTQAFAKYVDQEIKKRFKSKSGRRKKNKSHWTDSTLITLLNRMVGDGGNRQCVNILIRGSLNPFRTRPLNEICDGCQRIGNPKKRAFCSVVRAASPADAPKLFIIEPAIRQRGVQESEESSEDEQPDDESGEEEVLNSGDEATVESD